MKKTDIPMGEYSWLTVVSPENPDGTELVLEPNQHPAARAFQEALVADGIPFTSFAVDSVGRRAREAQSRWAWCSPSSRCRWAR